METRTFWMSFGNPDTKKHLGLAVVEVSESDVALVLSMKPEIMELPEEEQWVRAVIEKSHREGCNPGGDVWMARIDTKSDPQGVMKLYPRNKLMTKEEANSYSPIGAIEVDPKGKLTTRKFSYWDKYACDVD